MELQRQYIYHRCWWRQRTRDRYNRNLVEPAIGGSTSMKLRLTLVVLVIAACVGSRAQEASPCATLKTKNTQILRNFLQEQQSLRQSPCLPSVIKQLGQLHDVEAAHLLVGYLDYLDPKTAPLPNGGATVWPSYPAVGALFQ